MALTLEEYRVTRSEQLAQYNWDIAFLKDKHHLEIATLTDELNHQFDEITALKAQVFTLQEENQQLKARLGDTTGQKVHTLSDRALIINEL